MSIKTLQENNALRQAIFQLVLENEYDKNNIRTLVNYFSWNNCHSGLFIQEQDRLFIVDMAYHKNNINLWSCFLPLHKVYNKENQPNPLRKHMRKQALEKKEFLYAWAKLELENKAFIKKHNETWYGLRKKRYRQRIKKERKRRIKTLEYINRNKKIIEQGKHWNALLNFAQYVLMEPDSIGNKFGSKALVENALYNCIDFISPHIPDITELAKLQCESQSLTVEIVLYASCIEIIKRDNCLDKVPSKLLLALRTNLSLIAKGISKEQRQQLKNEVDRLVFKTNDQVEKFLRKYIEPQLENSNCKHAQVEWLRYDEIFQPFRKTLSLEWLERFPSMPFDAEKELFIQAVLYGDREKLIQLITHRCSELLLSNDETDVGRSRREFWFAKAIFFLTQGYEVYWEYLSQNKSSIFLFSDSFERIKENFPTLSPVKIEMVLNSFVDVWEKVPLPSTYGTGSPENERAYRILSNLVLELEKSEPDEVIPVVNRLLGDERYINFYPVLKSICFNQIRKRNLQEAKIPTPMQIVEILDKDNVVTVEGLRALVLEELQSYQNDLNGSDMTTKDIFYEKGERLDEVQSTLRIADRLHQILKNKGIIITLEHQLKNSNRCDITCAKIIDGRRRLLVIESKGQWHNELYSAFHTQLFEKYSIHPDAEQQGIYLVLWFGKEEKVANRSNKKGKNYKINSAEELKISIETEIPKELKGLIDVFVLDLSK